MQSWRWAARGAAAILGVCLIGTSSAAQSLATDQRATAGSSDTEPANGEARRASPAAVTSMPESDPRSKAILATGTPLLLMLDEELSTMTSKIGDRFGVTVVQDVYDIDRAVIPRGTRGFGEVTFATNKGAFGKPGILGISLLYLDLGDKQVALSGRYRQEGANKNGATVATWLAVGIFAGFIKGKPGIMPKGCELRARTGEAIAYAIEPLPISVPDAMLLAAATAATGSEVQSQPAPN